MRRIIRPNKMNWYKKAGKTYRDKKDSVILYHVSPNKLTHLQPLSKFYNHTGLYMSPSYSSIINDWSGYVSGKKHNPDLKRKFDETLEEIKLLSEGEGYGTIAKNPEDQPKLDELWDKKEKISKSRNSEKHQRAIRGYNNLFIHKITCPKEYYQEAKDIFQEAYNSGYRENSFGFWYWGEQIFIPKEYLPYCKIIGIEKISRQDKNFKYNEFFNNRQRSQQRTTPTEEQREKFEQEEIQRREEIQRTEKNKIEKLVISQTGEWWIIDGQAVFADSNIGDMNHSGYVIEHILSQRDIDIETFDLTKENEKSLREKGFNEEEINALLDKTDPRIYGMEKLGWKRVAGRNIQTQTLTAEDLKDIANGLYDINNELSEEDQTLFNIEVVLTGAYYVDIPYSIINEGNTGALRIYQENYKMANGFNWYKKANNPKKIVLSPELYDQLEDLAKRISKGNNQWTSEDLQLQNNNPEALEWFLRKFKNELV